MKKTLISVVSLILCVIMLGVCLAGCGDNAADKKEIVLPAFEGIEEQKVNGTIPDDFKIGLICLHDKNSTYDKNFIVAMEEVQQELGLKDEQVIIVTGIPEGVECY
ncbi:MAG: hypothetical protein II710_04705, partial [Clostridia bacterium]|nr:hypothetical protein [Clostridia bacterium]